MTALNRAIALAEVDHVAVPVGEHLHLDVSGILEIALDVDRGVGEVRLALASRRHECALRLVRVAHDLEALAAAARRRLDRDRPPELVAETAHLISRLHRLGDAGDDRHARREHPLARLDLRAHRLDRLGRRADPHESALATGACERGVLRQEAVARMNRLGACPPGRLEDSLLIQVALGRRAASDQVGLVGVGHVRSVAVGLRVHGDGPDPELPQGSEDADRDLTAVGNEDFAEDGHGPRILSFMSLPDSLTVARAASVPFVVVLYAWNFNGHDYWATALFAAAMATDWFDGRIARSRGHSSPLGSLLDPAADKILVLAVLIMLVDQRVVPGWMVALIVVREFLVTALRLAALERGVVLQARDLGKLKTWSQAVAAAIGGFAAAGAWRHEIAWWALLVAVVLTWISGLDYARVAPRLWRGGAAA